MFSKAVSKLELFNCRDAVNTCAWQDYWNDNMPAPFGRDWTVLSRAFLNVFFPQAHKQRKTSAPLRPCVPGALGRMVHSGTGRYRMLCSPEQAVSEENQGERPLQKCPPHF